MNTKKKTNIFLKILYFFFIIYLILLLAEKSGYYEKRVSQKTMLTEEKIKQFEEDVASNKVVTIEDYLPEEKDYSNFVTKSANKVSNKIGTLLNTKFDNIFDFIKSLFIG